MGSIFPTGILKKETPSPAVKASTPEEAKKLLRDTMTEYVMEGWKIEIENEFDAVLSAKYKQGWLGKFILFLILIFIWPPLALFYLAIALIMSFNSKEKNIRVYVDEDGYIRVA